MKLWRISQNVNNEYDTYDSAVVAAENVKEARMIHPCQMEWNGKHEDYGSWCAAGDVKVAYIGEAKEGTKKGVICASFNAG